MVPTTSDNRDALEPELQDGENQRSGENDHQLSTIVDLNENSLQDEDVDIEMSEAEMRALQEYFESFIEDLFNREFEPFTNEEEIAATDENESFDIFIVDEYEERVDNEPFWEIYIIVAMTIGILLVVIHYFPGF